MRSAPPRRAGRELPAHNGSHPSAEVILQQASPPTHHRTAVSKRGQPLEQALVAGVRRPRQYRNSTSRANHLPSLAPLARSAQSSALSRVVCTDSGCLQLSAIAGDELRVLAGAGAGAGWGLADATISARPTQRIGHALSWHAPCSSEPSIP